MNRIDDMIDISMSTYEAMPSVTVGGGVVNLDHVTTRKVAMVDELEVGPWLLMHHPRRFFGSFRGASQKKSRF
jgi:hypothetical protein